MYTANIVSKDPQPNGTVKIGVQFTDGTTTTPTEFIFPSDTKGLEFAVKARLDTLNFVAPAIGAYAPPVPQTPPALTQPEIDFNNFSRWTQLANSVNSMKQLGWITGNEPMVLAIRDKIIALASVNLPKMFL